MESMQSAKLDDALPGGSVHPSRCSLRSVSLLLLFPVLRASAFRSVVEEVQLLLGHLLRMDENAQAKEDGEEQLVALEETQTSVLVDAEGVVKVEGLAALVNGLLAFTARFEDGFPEQVDVCVQ